MINTAIVIYSRFGFLAAIYNYQGKGEHGLQLAIGDAVQIYEECSGNYAHYHTL